MPYFILGLGLVSFLIAVPSCALVQWISGRWGLVDQGGTEAHKPLRRPELWKVPNTGGVGVFVAIAWPMLAVLLGVWVIPEATWQRFAPAVVEHLPGLQQTTGIGGGLLVGLAAIHVMGLIDDRRAMTAWPKLAVQLAVAGLLAWYCDTRALALLDEYGAWGYAGSLAVSVLWIAAVTNAMNFLDNMDGLAAGVGVIAASLYLGATLIGGQWFVAALAALLVGSLGGFLIFNLPPARLYLGDGGSLVLGLMLSVIALRTTYFDTVTPAADVAGQAVAAVNSVHGPGRWYGLMMPVLVLAVPLYDFASVTLIRMRAGKSPFQGDHNHFSHRLLRMGLTKRMVLAVVYLATLATGLGGLMLGRLSGWQAVIVGVQAVAMLAVLAVLEMGARRGKSV